MEPLTYSVEEVGKLLGISRNSAFEAVHQGTIPSLRVGRRLLVPKAALERMLARAEHTDDATAEPSSASF